MQLPSEFVESLNSLGFVLTQDEPFRFARFALGSEVYVTVEHVGVDLWRVGVQMRQPDPGGTIPNPVLPVSLGELGKASDGTNLDLQTGALVTTFPRLLRECILPTIDLAPS